MPIAPNRRWLLPVLAGLTLAAVGLAPFVGIMSITPAMLGQPGLHAAEARVFFDLRVPRVLGALLVGMALALCGMVFQAVFRNPLATPFTLGTAGGAALGTALYQRFLLATGLAALPGAMLPGAPLAGFAGALACMGLVYFLTRIRGGFSSAVLLLAGVVMNFFCSSLILLIQYCSDFTQSYQLVRWLMGSVQPVDASALAWLAPTAVAGSTLIFLRSRELDLVLSGDDLAASRGVALARVVKELFATTSLLVGVVVAFCGPIGFVGLIAPHIGRTLAGPAHGRLAPVTALIGGLLLVVCDTLARTLVAPAEIPVGVITAVLGGPFFLWLLLARRPA